MSLSIDLCISGASYLLSTQQPVGVNIMYEVGVVGVGMYDCGMCESCVPSAHLQSDVCMCTLLTCHC